MIPSMKLPSIIKGVQTEGPYQYPYAGLILDQYEYRVYTDRSGWFVSGGWTPSPPIGAKPNKIKKVMAQTGEEPFLEYLADRLEKWKLKEMAGI